MKDNNCIQCPADKPYFNLLAKECQNCPDGFTWNATLHRCGAAKKYKPNVAAEPKVLVPEDAPKDALKTYMETGK